MSIVQTNNISFLNTSLNKDVFKAQIKIDKPGAAARVFKIKYVCSGQTADTILKDQNFVKRVSELVDLYESIEPTLDNQQFKLAQKSNYDVDLLYKNTKNSENLSNTLKKLTDIKTNEDSNKNKDIKKITQLVDTISKISSYYQTHHITPSPTAPSLTEKPSPKTPSAGPSLAPKKSDIETLHLTREDRITNNNELVKKSGKFCVLTKEAVALEEEFKSHQQKSKKDYKSKTLAQEHVKIHTDRYLEPIAPEGDPEKGWKALRVEMSASGNYVVKENQIYSTSERALADDPGLPNIYYHFEDGRLCISCGVIDTKTKADMFINAIRHICEIKKIQLPPRMNMHQLNSMGPGPLKKLGENKLIENQHQMVDYINSEFNKIFKPSKSTIYITHLNVSFNKMSDIPGERKASLANNRTGIAAQALWLLEDNEDLIKKNPNLKKLVNANEALKKSLDELNNLKNELLIIADTEMPCRETKETKTLKHKIEQDKELLDSTIPEDDSISDETENQIHKIEDDIDQLKAIKNSKEFNRGKKNPVYKKLRKNRDQLIKEINEFEKNTLQIKLKEFSSLLNEACGSDSIPKPLIDKLKIINHLLAIQTQKQSEYKLSELSVVEELGLQFLVDKITGSATQINCKSGLDRTGFARSFLIALEKKFQEEKDYGKLYEFIIHFESNVKEMDKNMKKESKRATRGEWLEKNLDNHKEFKEIYAFQNEILYQLCNVALPITGRSTGVEGLKWHHDTHNFFAKNPVPLPWLPYVVKDENGKYIKLIGDQITSWDRFLKPEGIALLMGRSAERGG